MSPEQRRLRLLEIERGLLALTKEELKGHLHINYRMGDYRNGWNKAPLMREVARGILVKEIATKNKDSLVILRLERYALLRTCKSKSLLRRLQDSLNGKTCQKIGRI